MKTAAAPPAPREAPWRAAMMRFPVRLILSIVFTSLGVTFAVLFVGLHHVRPHPDSELDERGQVTQGVLKEKLLLSNLTVERVHPWCVEFEYSPKEGDAPRVAAAFTIDPLFEGIDPGEDVKIEFLPDEPGVARPVGGRVRLSPPIHSLAPLVLLPVAAVFVSLLIAATVREVRLLRTGRETVGRVESARLVRGVRVNEQSPYDVCYAFADSTGCIHRGRTRTIRVQWAQQLRTNDGVGVVYDPSDPRRSTLWLLSEHVPKPRETGETGVG